MPRLLTKDDLLEYVPAVAATPYIPGYNVVVGTWPAGSMQTNYAEIRDAVGGSWSGGNYFGNIASDGTITVSRRYPAVAGTAGRAAYTIDHGVAEWNAGGNSISPLDGDGAWSFTTSRNPGGAVVGFVTANTSYLPAEPTHAIYVSGGVAKVMERGVIKYTFPAVVTGDTSYEIRRTGTAVTYVSGPDIFYSSVPVTTAKIYLDAALFLSGDYVDSDGLLDGDSGLTVGVIDGSLPKLKGITGTAFPYYIEGTLPRLRGLVYNSPFGGYVTAIGSLPPLGGQLTGMAGRRVSLDGNLPKLFGVAANYNYSYIEGSLKPLKGYLSPYAEDGQWTARSATEFGDLYLGAARVRATVMDTIRYASTAKGVVRAKDYVFDGVQYDDMVSSQQALFDAINSAVEYGSGTKALNASDLTAYMVAARAPRNYAVNVVSTALTTYDGFDFLSYARTTGRTYAARSEGVYVLREGDDAGAPRIVAVDFGVIPLSANSARIIETIYLGMVTDGEVFVRIQSGEHNYVYPAIVCQELLRAIPGKGAKLRQWNVSLEVEGSTFLNLDLVEMYITDTRRRWAKG